MISILKYIIIYMGVYLLPVFKDIVEYISKIVFSFSLFNMIYEAVEYPKENMCH